VKRFREVDHIKEAEVPGGLGNCYRTVGVFGSPTLGPTGGGSTDRGGSTDPSGAAVVSAQVTATQTETNAVHTAVTDASGFTKYLQTGILLSAGNACLVWPAAMSPAQNRPVASTSTEVAEKVAGGFTRSEGPVWVRQGYLLFSDFEQSRIFRLTPPNEVTVYLDRTGAANGRMRSGGELSRFAEPLSNTSEST
jgi:hypothetical protein